MAYKDLTPVINTDSPYLTEAAMHADQANQLQGYGYLVDGVGAFTYLGTVAGTAADYEGFGGGTGLDLRASNLAGDLSVGEQNDIKEKLSIQIDSNFRPFITKWNITSGDVIEIPSQTTINVNFFRIEWGDGTIENYTGAIPCTHTYNTTGEFIVKIYGALGVFTFSGTPTSAAKITEIVQWGDVEWGDIDFKNCINLSTLPNESPDFLKTTSLSILFRNCNLSTIPSELLKKAVIVTSLKYAFRDNVITILPSDLLDNCVNVTDYQSAFRGNLLTSLPIGLFKKSYSAVSFQQTFLYNQITVVQANTFDNCISAVSFYQTFGGNQIATIEEGLFDDCTAAKDFTYTFKDNFIETLPENLFFYTIFATKFESTFTNNKLTGIPLRLFEFTPRVRTFYEIFRYNEATLTGIVPELWLKFTDANITTSGAFALATDITNYADIPATWK